ncbi:MAG: WD40 repeat domain-containing protein [Chloroflexi bacterium]|nr:WD40 repeat domain-containing protein [Chloroflexota bacterium]
MRYALPIILTVAATAALACQVGGLAPTPTAIPSPAPTVASSPTPLPTVPPPTATPSAPVIDALNAAGLAPRYVIPASLNDVKRVTFSPDGRLLATASGGNSLSSDYAVRLWNPADGTLVFTLEGHAGIVWDVAFAPDGRWLASVSDDKTLRVWDTRAGVLAQVAHLPGPANSVVFSRDGTRLVVGVALGKDGLLYNYDLASGTLSGGFAAHAYSVPSLALSPDGGTLVSLGTVDRTIKVWIAGTLEAGPLKTFSLGGQGGNVVFSPDGGLVATGLCVKSTPSFTCTQGEAWLWRVADGVRPVDMQGATGKVQAVAISPNGQLVAGGAEDQTIWIWRLADGQPVTRLTGHRTFLESVAFSPDGRLLASSSTDGMLIIWAVR